MDNPKLLDWTQYMRFVELLEELVALLRKIEARLPADL